MGPAVYLILLFGVIGYLFIGCMVALFLMHDIPPLENDTKSVIGVILLWPLIIWFLMFG